MTDPQLQAALSQLFKNTAQAHHQAFAETNGEDPDWPLWYAQHLKGPIEELADMEFHTSHLVYCLMNADFEHVARSPNSDWADFWAAEFIEHFAASETAEEDRLALYYMPTCLFCRRVMKTIENLKLDVELRNVSTRSDYRAELLAERGRTTVPVLWIRAPDGDTRWMPESQDIIHYLETTYGS